MFFFAKLTANLAANRRWFAQDAFFSANRRCFAQDTFFLLTGDDLQTARDYACSPPSCHRQQAPLRKKQHAPACLPKPATANKRRFAKSNMPLLACPNPQPQTGAALQKQHAYANSPTPAIANTRRSAKEACPRFLAHSRNR